MAKMQKTVAKLKKTSELTNLAFHKFGPKSFKNGVGALVIALHKADGTLTQRELVDILGMGRKGVKTIVKKAMRKGLVVIGDHEDKKTYTVALTDDGKAVAAKRIEADKAVAAKVLDGLTDEEIQEFNAVCDKIIINVKGMGVSGKKRRAFKHGHGRKHAPMHCAHHGRHGHKHCGHHGHHGHKHGEC